LVANNVPAYACPHCREAYIDEKIAAQLLLAVEEMYKVGLPEETIDYERLPLK
jgi:hypothetical protein